MLDQMQKTEVQDVVRDISRDREMFTAYDITRRVRSHTNDRIFHDDVKAIVHEMWTLNQMPMDYDRKVISLGTGRSPFVYFPDGKNPDDYQPLAMAPQSGSFAPAAPVAPAAGPVSDPVDDDEEEDEDDGKTYVRRNKKGRIRITRKFLKHLGGQKRDTIRCYPVGPKIRIRLQSDFFGTSATGSKFYNPDQYGNIRLNPRWLNKTTVQPKLELVEHDDAQGKYIDLIP